MKGCWRGHNNSEGKFFVRILGFNLALQLDTEHYIARVIAVLGEKAAQGISVDALHVSVNYTALDLDRKSSWAGVIKLDLELQAAKVIYGKLPVLLACRSFHQQMTSETFPIQGDDSRFVCDRLPIL